MTHIRRTSDTNGGMTDDFRTGSHIECFIDYRSRAVGEKMQQQLEYECITGRALRYRICGAIDTIVKAGSLLGLVSSVLRHRLRHAKGLTR